MIKNAICILFLLGCVAGFIFDLIWTINASHAWIGFFSLLVNAVGIYVSLRALSKK